MERAFCDSRGFNYRKFLEEITPKPTWNTIYADKMTQREIDMKVRQGSGWSSGWSCGQSSRREAPVIYVSNFHEIDFNIIFW